MNGKQVTYIEMTHDELDDRLRIQRDQIVKELSGPIRDLTKILSHQAPSLTKDQAAAYCNKSTSWLDKSRDTHNLPVKIVAGHPRFLRSDLDHFLQGGTFDKDGNPIEAQINHNHASD